MRFRGELALAGLAFVCPAFARTEPAICGTHPLKLKEEMFLHRQALRKRPAARSAGVAPVAAGADVGNVAVLDSSSGVLVPRNQFDLDQRTLSFLPIGANASSYRFTLGDPTYDADAALAGRLLPLGDDDAAAVPLPFGFPFFGAAYSQVWVNSDGNLTFNLGDGISTERSLGRLAGGPPRIGALLADLDPSRAGGSGGVRLLSESGRMVVTWDRVPLYSDAGTGVRQTFQLRLYPDGRIEIAYNGISLDSAVVGIAPGAARTAGAVLSFLTDPSAVYTGLVAERFSNTVELDLQTAAQQFFAAHEDAYDYLVFYNNMGIPAGAGAVAWESTVRNHRSGYGDAQVDVGRDFGSARRLQGIINLGSLSQFPLDPKGRVLARGPTGDTPLSVAAHEAGHLFLAYASVRDPDRPGARPMLGFQNAHWIFNFNSDASLLEGNRIQDGGAGVSPRFTTVGAVEAFSPLDQYLMGLIPVDEVEPAYPFGLFYVTGVPASFSTRLPQNGVTFNGDRRDVHMSELIDVLGRRSPDWTVSQRHFRFAFILIAAAGVPPSPADLAQVENYRAGFDDFYAQATGRRAFADTALKRSLRLSLFPAAGVMMGRTAGATISVETPPSVPMSVALSTQTGSAGVPASVVIPAGALTAAFSIRALRAGVEDVTATPADSRYAAAHARIQVAAAAAVQLVVESGDGQQIAKDGSLVEPVVARLTDINQLPYPGVRVTASASAPGSVMPAAAVTDDDGRVTFHWTAGNVDSAQLRLSVADTPEIAPLAASAQAPRVRAASVLNAATLQPVAAPGMLASLYGINLEAAGTEVRLDGRIMPLVSVERGRIQFYILPDVPLGISNVVVHNALGASDPVTVPVAAAAPGIFADVASGFAAGLERPAARGSFIEIYCTGLGVHPEDVEVSIGGQPAAVSYSGPAPGLPGVNQVNAQIPQAVPPGTHTLMLTIHEIRSNVVKIGVE